MKVGAGGTAKEEKMKRICVIWALIFSAYLPSITHADPKEDGFWNSVAKGNVAEEYELYLEQYPKGKYAPEAKRRLDKLKGNAGVVVVPEPVVRTGADATPEDILWATVKQNHRAEEYQAYLQAYPQGRYVSAAKVQMQKLTREAEDAARKADDEAWRTAEVLGSSAAIQRYLDSYPQGRHRSKAVPLLDQARLKEVREAEDTAWKTAEAKSDWESYKAYGDAYPKGAYLPLLQLRLKGLESKEWSDVEKTLRRGTLERFIKRYPQGQYVAQAKLNLANLPATTLIADRYESNSDGTVNDYMTKLQWMRCAMGQSWNGSTCQGEASKYKWEDARQLGSNFARYSDWRLPSISELKSLVYCSSGSPRTWSDGEVCQGNFQRPTIAIEVFPISNMYFWSGSSNNLTTGQAWGVYFGNGYAGGSNISSGAYVRLVRGGGP
jgi:outer membrane protein assembly factor BamD (BamD/ComL family)